MTLSNEYTEEETYPIEESSWPDDLFVMHGKFNFYEVVLAMQPDVLRKFLDFRVNTLKEELAELDEAVANEDSDGIVDAIIDLCVFAVGTLDLFGVDAQEAWNRVMNANFKKEVGEKATRKNDFGFPDLIKPPDWEAPTHQDNTGILDFAFGKIKL